MSPDDAMWMLVGYAISMIRFPHFSLKYNAVDLRVHGTLDGTLVIEQKDVKSLLYSLKLLDEVVLDLLYEYFEVSRDEMICHVSRNFEKEKDEESSSGEKEIQSNRNLIPSVGNQGQYLQQTRQIVFEEGLSRALREVLMTCTNKNKEYLSGSRL
ncbi:uncharacterized protein A4U43_C02F5580 [Asparagus officinalis]|uniref:Uncharacterized protein n=1 Tax=Asparagus officinalis TaxID=4686 RepID=A0A5P1FG51_ASPOF|nr:uncharacterized protein A4U43_C02F5580 [Asparagus officinalis]